MDVAVAELTPLRMEVEHVGGIEAVQELRSEGIEHRWGWELSDVLLLDMLSVQLVLGEWGG